MDKKTHTKKTLGTIQAHVQPCALMHMLLHETGTKTRDRTLFYIGKNILQSRKLTTIFKIKIYVVLCLICKIKSNQMDLFKNRRIAYIIFFVYHFHFVKTTYNYNALP